MLKCPRCEKEKEEKDIRWMWDFQKENKQYLCMTVCSDCDKELAESL